MTELTAPVTESLDDWLEFIEQLHSKPIDLGLERMNLMKARKAVIKAVRPGMRLDGKSAAFINAAYAMACEEIRTRKRKDTKYQKRQMFNGTKRPMAHADSSDKARDRMIKKQMSRSK